MDGASVPLDLLGEFVKAGAVASGELVEDFQVYWVEVVDCAE